MRRILLSTAIGALGVFNGVADAQSSYTLKDDQGTEITVFEYSQDLAKADLRLADNLAESVGLGWTEEEGLDLDKVAEEKDIDLRSNTVRISSYRAMRREGISDETADMISGDISAVYANPKYNFSMDRTSPINGFTPSALRFKEKNTHKDEATLCLITAVEGGYTYKDWFNALTQRKVYSTVKFPAEYDLFASEFAIYHEQAHCFGANEEQSDFIASLHLMRLYQEDYPETLKGFLQNRSAERYYGQKLSVSYKYTQTGSAILASFDYYNQNKENLDESAIWSIITNEAYPSFLSNKNTEEKRLAFSVNAVKRVSHPTEASEKAENYAGFVNKRPLLRVLINALN